MRIYQMGHCLSCFREQPNIGSHKNLRKNDEVTEIIPCGQDPVSRVADHPQSEPLLENENTIFNHPIVPDTQNTTHIHSDYDEQCNDGYKVQNSSEKVSKPFFQKMPSIPKSLPSLVSNDGKVSDCKINQLFDHYKDSLEDAILAEGIENLCNDLQLNPDDFKVLVLAWKLNASQMCRFTRTEFTQGLKNMKTDSIKGIQLKLNEITGDLKCDSEQFKDLYRFTFKFGLDVTSGQRILPIDIAIVLWRLVFTNNERPILDRWLNYLANSPHVRGIPKDTWYMFLNFCEYIGDDLSSYDDTEAWPSLFDDFVEYENDQTNQNISKNDLKIQE